MCKHISAVLYGVGARLDTQPELLFLLRGVDHQELIATNAEAAVSRATSRGGRRKTLTGASLSDVFGIELDDAESANGVASKPRAGRQKRSKTAKESIGAVVAVTATEGKAAKTKKKPKAKTEARNARSRVTTITKRPSVKKNSSGRKAKSAK
jgi:uncharacterized Zn finger protein